MSFFQILMLMLLISIIVSGIISCDKRIATPQLKLIPTTTKVYLNDNSIINIHIKYTNEDSIYNQRLYFQTDNGLIRPGNINEWTEQDSLLTLNTDLNGQCLIQYSLPSKSEYSIIKCWTYIYKDLVLVDQLQTTLKLIVLQR